MMPPDSQGLIQLAAILGEGYRLGFLRVVTRSVGGKRTVERQLGQTPAAAG